MVEKAINRWLVVTLAGTLIFGALAFVFRNAEHDSSAVGDEYYPVCDYIDIELVKLDAVITPYDGDEIRVVYSSDLPLEVETGDNRLMISESERLVISLFAEAEEKAGLAVYLPDRIYREISVYTGPGNIETGRLNCHSMSIVTESGDITCKQTVSQFSLSTTSGFISADIEVPTGESNILSRKGSAEVFISPKASVAVEFETVSGEYIAGNSGTYHHAGSGTYSINGGDKTIYAAVQEGTLTIKER